jgi:uncharacterized protein YpmB
MSTTASSTVGSSTPRWLDAFSNAIRTTPGRLQLVQALIVVATFLYVALSLSFYSYLDKAASAIGHDSAPSIIAAQSVRGVLGDAHANLADAFVLKEEQNGDHWRAYRDDMKDVHEQLLNAAQNVTYGDAERKPILETMQYVGEYERLVGQSIEQGDGASLDEADVLMRTKIQPAAIALDKANFEPLTRTWEDFKAHATGETAIVLLGAGTLLALLVFGQIYVFRATRRLLNPGLLAATVVFVVSTGMMAYTVLHVRSDMRVAKEDAFDSIHALWKARAEAYAANAETSFYLLDGANSQDRTQRLAAFKEKKDLVLSATPQQVGIALEKKTRLKGLLGDELANITFDGEGEAALQTVEYWNDYVSIYQSLLSFDVESAATSPDKALELSQNIARSDLAFGSFDNSLEKALDINENAFDNSIDKAVANISRLPWLIAITAFLVIVACVLGLRPRINKYRF